MTRVRITLEMDSEFVRFLKNQLYLDGIMREEESPNKMWHTALGTLGLVACSEAMGGHPEQTYLNMAHEWRGHIDVVPEERRTLKEGATEWEVTKP